MYGDRWRVIGSLGEGGQAHTFHVTDQQTGSAGFVLKRLINVNRKGRFEREVTVLQRLDAQGIPKIIDFGVDDKGRGFLVTHYLGEDLTKMRLGDDILTVLSLFRQVVEAAAVAHAAGVVHRDIKPDNIVCDPDRRVSLIDFGICAEELNGDGLVLTTALEGFGNRSFAAPECEAGSLERASAASDVYSLGKVLYWLTASRRQMVRERLDIDTIVASDSFEKYCVAELIARAVVEAPQQRWTTSELLGGIDWVTEKLKEHRREAPAIIVVDSFGPDGQYNESGLRSATTPPRGNPPAVNYVGQAFQMDYGQCNLSRIARYVTNGWRRSCRGTTSRRGRWSTRSNNQELEHRGSTKGTRQKSRCAATRSGDKNSARRKSLVLVVYSSIVARCRRCMVVGRPDASIATHEDRRVAR